MWKEKLYRYFFFNKERSRYTLSGEKIKKGGIVLEYWKEKINLGDALSSVIYEWMLNRENIQTPINQSNKIIHLLSVGSILNMGDFDSIVWGSGVLSIEVIKDIFRKAEYRCFDIRAVRGPITRKILETAGYDVPGIYGDPVILMPYVYKPKKISKTIPYIIIPHYSEIEYYLLKGYTCLDIRTTDYKYFIDQMIKSKLVISSSLHGIILAEAYGIPAVLLHNNNIDLLKYYDYYYSTDRQNIVVASSIEEALALDPMPLPNLNQMQNDLLRSFPYDLFDKRTKR